jgi:hypothetical protein
MHYPGQRECTEERHTARSSIDRQAMATVEGSLNLMILVDSVFLY